MEEFIRGLLEINKQERLGSKGYKQVINHPWLKNFNWEELKEHKVRSCFQPNLELVEQYIQQLTDNNSQLQIQLKSSKQTKELFKVFLKFEYSNVLPQQNLKLKNLNNFQRIPFQTLNNFNMENKRALNKSSKRSPVVEKNN